MNSQPDDDLIRELYASFGLAYCQSECLHRSLCMILAWSGLPQCDLITRSRVEERLAQAFSLTFGDVTAKLEGVIPAEMVGEVREAVKTRNFVAHYFWFERAHLMFSANNIRQLITELNGYADMFERIDNLVTEWSEPLRKGLGFTDEVFQETLKRILAGDPGEPLPDRQTVRNLEKKLSRKQRLIRVWQFVMDNGRKHLIFELADGSLWQLSDVGLGWTRFQEVGPSWTEHPAIKPHLPAYIIPRPKSPRPWDYEFTLAKGAVLWVKPSGQMQTFKWGVRSPTKSAKRRTELDGNSIPIHPRR